MATLMMLPLGLALGFVLARVVRLALVTRGSGRPDPREATAHAPSARGQSVASAARSVGGALGQRRNLPLPQLQRAVFSEMIRHVGRRRDGRSVVPTSYVVLLHPDDHTRVVEAQRWFVGDLVNAMRRAARDNGWTVPGSIGIRLAADGSRRPGTPTVETGEPAGGPPTQPVAPGPGPRAGLGSATLVRIDGGTDERHELDGDAVTIGRGADRDVRVPEARASRNHGTFRRTATGWTYTDDGSSNGTLVNGRPVAARQPVTLGSGSRIVVGPAEFRLDVTDSATDAAPPGEDATAVLDARSREDLTGRYFPSQQ